MSHSHRIWGARLLLLGALWLSPGALGAQSGPQGKAEGEVSRLTMELSDEIYSPFCPGKSLSMCPSPNAAKVRRDIQQLAKEGKDKEAIKQVILETYGEEFRIVEPPAQDNMGLLAALAIGLLAAAVAVVLLSRGLKSRGEGLSAKTPSGEDGVNEEVAEALTEEERSYLKELREDVGD